MSKQAGSEGGTPTTVVAASNMTLGEVVVVAGFSCGYPVLTSLPLSQITDPVAPAAPPTGSPTETGVLQWDLAITDTDVPLSTPPTTVVVGSVFLIDTEYMTVSDISNIDNPKVTRATHGSTVAAHAAGAAISIWGPPVKSATGKSSSKATPTDPGVAPEDKAATKSK